MAKFTESTEDEPEFVSRLVTQAKRYYANLTPDVGESLSLVCGGVEKMRPDYVVTREDFPFCALEMVVEGGGTVLLNGRSFPLEPGTVFAYGPGVPHSILTDPARPMRKYYVDFAGVDAAQSIAKAGLENFQPVQVTAFHEVIEVFDWLAREGERVASRRDETDVSISEHLLRLLFLKVRQRVRSGTEKMPQAFHTFERIRDHMTRHRLRLTTVEQVAKECEVTPIYLSRLFKRFCQLGAYQFLVRQKMLRAAELLLDEGMLVKEVADHLGYTDPFQFSRAFKRVFGVPPKNLLESRRTGDRTWE
ncbi:MAG: AraC family transcriptional regulator [Planctomycetota bacterium]